MVSDHSLLKDDRDLQKAGGGEVTVPDDMRAPEVSPGMLGAGNITPDGWVSLDDTPSPSIFKTCVFGKNLHACDGGLIRNTGETYFSWPLPFFIRCNKKQRFPVCGSDLDRKF